MSTDHFLSNKFWYIYTMKCYLATKNSKLLICTTLGWIRTAVLSERRRHKRRHALWLHLWDILEKIKYAESRPVLSQGRDCERPMTKHIREETFWSDGKLSIFWCGGGYKTKYNVSKLMDFEWWLYSMQLYFNKITF